MSNINTIIMFRTIQGKTIHYELKNDLNKEKFISFQDELRRTPYRLIYFGRVYPFFNDDNDMVYLTYKEHYNEITYIVDTSKRKTPDELENDVNEIVLRLNEN